MNIYHPSKSLLALALLVTLPLAATSVSHAQFTFDSGATAVWDDDPNDAGDPLPQWVKTGVPQSLEDHPVPFNGDSCDIINGHVITYIGYGSGAPDLALNPDLSPDANGGDGRSNFVLKEGARSFSTPRTSSMRTRMQISR